ncbi:MAG: Sensor histidine kinase TmoS [Candidatus Ordinivivax streblomastigis]|uniref:histidine kinase n=1 Tax=Candidatus Ordinivivax streblomastigis TaxID=2540710 RepID=A0A5M8NU52_9BACT|nr:MAG: Sensor histidine kinase TmoS [Candidatus Ordinivivax streblomastigis]
MHPSYIPPISFNKLTIFGNYYNIFEKTTEKDGETILNLKYEEDFFSVSFTANDYIDGSNYTYYYKLLGLSNQWINNGHSNVASFTNVPPGKYTLQVKYYNRTSNIESPVYSMVIKIAYPWYLSIWAYCFYCLALILMLAVSVRYIFLKEKRKKQELLDQLDKKHQKEVYESKLRFFTNIAHEFCTPLTLISGPCERILGRPDIDAFVANYVKMIQANANRLNNLICELIEFRKIETENRKPQIEPLLITDLVLEISALFSDMAASKKISLDIIYNQKITWNSDKGFMTTIITNLLSNAFKYTQNGKRINLGVSIENGNLLIQIANQGNPIKEKDYKRIFDRYTILDNFERQDGKPAFSRNGLGLAISHNMVKLLNGTIRVENTPEQWVVFTVSLPMSIVNTDKPAEQNDKEYLPVAESPRILKLPDCEIDELKPTLLIIDDEPEILWFICEIFSDEFNTIAIQYPEQIDTVLNETLPDVIISDVMMPKLTGIDLVKKVKSVKNTAHIPIILISGKYEMEQQMEALGAGAETYITKPFNAEYLKMTVRQSMNRKEKLKDYFNSSASLFDLLGGKQIHKEHKKFFRSVLKIIDSNITNPDLSIQMIAKELNMGVRSLYRRIEETGAMSPANLIKECRLVMARDLLVKSRMNIDEILYKSGFANRVSFFQAFSKKYGCTPKEYRMKMVVEKPDQNP